MVSNSPTSKDLSLGARWTTGAMIVSSVVQMLRLAILTRFLEKSDFGVVALITFVLGLTQTFSDLGFSTAIMHRKNLNDQEFSSLYWIQLFIFLGCFLFVTVLSEPISLFYNEPQLIYALPVAFFDLLLLGVGKLYEVLLQKNMRFKTLAIRSIVSAFISLFVAYILAYLNFGIYSIILSTLFQTLVLQLWNYIGGQQYHKVRLYCSIKTVKPLIKIGLYQMGTQIMDYLSSKIDILIVGKFLGTEALGVYNLAKELVRKIVAIINSIANKVALPYFSFIQDDKAVMRSNYCRFLGLLSFINFPICLLTGALSTPIVTILYGSNYSDLAPIVSLLSIWGLIVCIANPVGNIVTATGRTDLSFKYTIVNFCLSLPIVFISAKIGLQPLAIGQIILETIILILSWYFNLYKTINLKLGEFFKSYLLYYGITMTVGISVWFICSLNLLQINAIFSCIVYGLITIVIYIGCLLAFDRENTLSLSKSLIKLIGCR